MVKFNSLRPMLWTDKLEETIEFYTNVLGFKLGEKSEEWGWASLYKDDVDLMLARPNEHTPFEKPQFTGSFYINTNNVDEPGHN